MATFDLEAKPGAWFDMDGGGRVQLRILTPEDWRSIRRQAVKVVPEYTKLDGKWERFEVVKSDDELQDVLFWDALIVGWEGLFDAKGREIPCTKEMKALLMLTQPSFSRFIRGCIDILTPDEAKRQEASEKN